MIEEPAQNSVGQNFAGGAYAMYFASTGIEMWFFPVSPGFEIPSSATLIGRVDVIYSQ